MERTFPSFDKSITDSHLPATEVKRIAMQNPNLASDFIEIRVTAMTVRVDFAPVILFSSEPRFASSVPLLHKLLCFRPLSLLTSDQYIEMIYSSILIDDRGGKEGSYSEAGWGYLITNIHCK